MNILITGGAGFIGSALSQKLSEIGHNVIILDSLSFQIHGTSADVKIKKLQKFSTFIKGDIRDERLLKGLIRDSEILIHLAAETGTGQSMYDLSTYTDVNGKGTAVLLETIIKSENKIKQFILTSSRAVYGEGKYICSEHGTVFPGRRKNEDLSKGSFECQCPICNQNVAPVATDENSQLNPVSIYGITKQFQEQLLKTSSEFGDFAYTIFRPQNIYGPGQSLINPYTGILSIFSNLILHNQTINIFEDGKQLRDFIYIDDVVESIIGSINNPVTFNKVMNLGTGNPTSLIELVETLSNSYNTSGNYQISGDYRLGDIRNNFANIEDLSKILKFVPEISIQKGIKKFAEWLLENKPAEMIDYKKALNETKKK